MSKVINLEEFKKEKEYRTKLNNIKFTREDRIKAREKLLYDDDKYLEMFYEDEEKSNNKQGKLTREEEIEFLNMLEEEERKNPSDYDDFWSD